MFDREFRRDLVVSVARVALVILVLRGTLGIAYAILGF